MTECTYLPTQSLRTCNPVQYNQYIETDYTSEGWQKTIWTPRTLPRR